MRAMNKMNRRGDLLNEILGVLLFLAGAAILVFVIVKVYNIIVNQETEDAKRLIDEVRERSEAIKENEAGKFVVKGLKGWFLTGWGRDDLTRPDKCFFKSCICICKGKGNAKDICQENGICRDVTFGNVLVADFAKLNIEGVVMNFKAEDVIKEKDKSVYFNVGRWSSDGRVFNLLSECAEFEKNELVEFLIYKDENDLNLFKIKPWDGVIEGISVNCKRS